MAKEYVQLMDGSKKVRLRAFDPRNTAGLDKDKALRRLEALGQELAELSNLLAYAGRHALLVILQGRDASGKDGAIRKILEFANVLNASVRAFKPPTAEEAAHDFLWRVHKAAPAKGHMALFNRSHYEDVIAARVHRLVSADVWKGRYQQINGFEGLLAASGTIVVKLYLHISREEQYQRLLEREKDPLTAWKLDVGDWREMPLWEETELAYEDAFNKCSSKEVPWYLVPADRKWFRNLAIFDRLVRTLRPYRAGWLKHLKGVRRAALKEIAQIRRQTRPPT